jgi:hypothetical protein
LDIQGDAPDCHEQHYVSLRTFRLYPQALIEKLCVSTSETDTAHKDLNYDSNIPANDSVLSAQWPSPRATELLVAVEPHGKMDISRKTRRKRQGRESDSVAPEIEGSGASADIVEVIAQGVIAPQ